MLPRSSRLAPRPAHLGFRLAAAQNHEVVGVADHLETSRRQMLVKRIKIYIGQQLAGDGLNAKDNVGGVGALAAGEVGEVAAAS